MTDLRDADEDRIRAEINKFFDEFRIQAAAAKQIAVGLGILKWSLLIATLIGPPVYLAYRPTEYTPFLEVLLNAVLFILAYWIGNSAEIKRAEERANDRWLPQAESVILRLMTLRANVVRLSRSTKANCGATACDLPELEKEENRAIRVKLRADCEASSHRLDDVAHQLEDAIEDWRRFIVANCHGDECTRIFEALSQREEGLSREFSAPTPATVDVGLRTNPQIPPQGSPPEAGGRSHEITEQAPS